MTALIIGGTRGIGLECALKCKWPGLGNSAVIVAGRSRPESLNPNLTFVQCDVRQPASIDQMCSIVHKATDGKGPLHLVYASGVFHQKPLATQSEEDIRDILDTNTLGALLVAKHMSKMYLSRNGGSELQDTSMTFIGSIVGSHGQPGLCTYSASKAALGGLTRSLALEMARKRVRVNLIEPGFVKTKMLDSAFSASQLDNLVKRIPAGRIGRVDDIVKAVDFLTECGYITGQTICVDGGLRL